MRWMCLVFLLVVSSTATAGSNTENLSFAVKLENTCTISATDINFGNVGLSSRRYETTASIQLKCTAGMPYSIQLVETASADGTIFEMRNANGDMIHFKTRSQSFSGPAWIGPNFQVTGIATGSTELKTIYAFIPSGWTGANPDYGNYSLPMSAVINF